MIEHCWFCGDAITSLGECLVLNDRFAKWPEAFFAHSDCCDERDPIPLTYGIHLHRIALRGDDAQPHTHLREKNWVTSAMIDALHRAHELAREIKAPNRRAVALGAHAGIRDARQKITGKVRAYVFARDGHRCNKCGAPPPLVIDHIMPVSKGGSGEPENLRSLCWQCNSAKGAQLETVQ